MMRKIFFAGSIMLIIICLITSGMEPVLAQDNDYKAMDKPFSIEAGDNVEKIPINSTIHHFSDGTTEVYGPDNARVLITRDSDVSSIPVPSCGSLKASHVYEVPSGSMVTRNGDEIKIYYNRDCILTVIDDKIGEKAGLQNLLQEEQTLLPPPSTSG